MPKILKMPKIHQKAAKNAKKVILITPGTLHWPETFLREVLSSLGWLLPTGPGAAAHISIIFARTSYSACLFLPIASLVLYQKEKDPTAKANQRLS